MSHQTSAKQKNWLYFALGSGSSLVIGGIVFALLNFFSKPTQSQAAGTWQMETNGPPGGLPAITVVISNDGKVTVLNPANIKEAIELGKITKISDVAVLPEGANVQANLFINQSTKAKQSEAKTYTGSMNRAQQAYQLEKNQWAKNLDALAIGIKPETENYRYRVKIVNSIKTVNTKNNAGIAVNTAIAKKDGLKSYVGIVYLSNSGSSAEINSLSVLCESQQPTTKQSGLPKFDGKQIKCPSDYVLIQ